MDWIPVTRKLPGSDEHPGATCEMCIVSSEKYGVTVGWYNRYPTKNRRWYILIWKLREEDDNASMAEGDIPKVIISDDITAWMPYPEKYKDDDKELERAKEVIKCLLTSRYGSSCEFCKYDKEDNDLCTHVFGGSGAWCSKNAEWNGKGFDEL